MQTQLTRKPKEKCHWTDARYLSLPDNGKRYELFDGKLVAFPAAFRNHGAVATRLSHELMSYLDAYPIGTVYDSSTGFRMPNSPLGKTLLMPDVSLPLHRGEPETLEEQIGFGERAPDFVAEILSSRDSFRATVRKVARYFDNGARIAWVISPRKKEVHVFTSAEEATVRHPGDTLDLGNLLPGFTLPVNKLLGNP